ncbi:MAG: immune inhibitor A [Mycobacteriales bacterium]|nr:immune inhibitor A [Mycobacteriales bacterium]
MPRPSLLRAATRGTALLALVGVALPAVGLLATTATASTPTAPGASVPAEPPSTATIGGLAIENSFVSSVGWVKPGDSYPSRILVRNPGTAAVSGLSVRIPETRGMSWTGSRSQVGTTAVSGGVVTWSVPSVGAGASVALVLEAAADTLAEEPTVVWRNISSTATVSVGSTSKALASHGPKVIPPSGGYETARYGDRPFPVVPVDYVDFTHTASAGDLDKVINDPANPASTFNLFQEMSYGQLYPKGTIGSVAIGDAPYEAGESSLAFTTIDPETVNTCTGVTTVDPTNGAPTPLYTERIVDGWYQLPGTRSYYGQDANGSALVGALAGVGALQNIDSGCGPAAKAAYDAAVIADPDIDYNDFDTDKDGVVDFFEVVFQGCGGNGVSQLSVAGGCTEAPNDNVWPHSSSLEFSYTDAVTGLTGYVSKDRLKDLEGNLLWYTDDSFTKTTTTDTGDALAAFVRVGPYNLNPETSIEFASVISHEYGHSLGLPDYYSTGSRETYGDFNLMASDASQNMDVIGKKELGWIVPRVLRTGTTTLSDWRDSKLDTGRIDWVTPDGRPYTLSAQGGDYGIHNGEAYVASLPGRQLIDPAIIEQGASGKRVWYSRQGNDFGCAPIGGHNLDVVVPGLGDLPDGATVTATFSSFWDIEWDYDYGFVLAGTPDEKGKLTYAGLASQNGYSTPSTQNPNANSCLTKYGNGLTGTSGSYEAGTQALDRVLGNTPKGGFLEDSYDLSSLAGVEGGVLRFSYATDPGLARPGWLIDDLKVVATVDGAEQVLFDSDFEDGDGGSDDPRVYNGGCKEDLSVSGGVCTEGWSYLEAGTPSSQEHAYLLEMRDRSGFDFDGRGESERGAPSFQSGLLLTYTDEAHGYGNVGTDNPPAQSPLDSTPEPESDTPNLDDATFTAADARRSFTDSKATPHVDNYSEPTRDAAKDPDADGVQPWVFDYDCLAFDVTSMDGDSGGATEEFDLVGDVKVTTAGGCADFNYGFADTRAVAPPIGGPGLPNAPNPETDTPPTAAPALPATGGLGAPVLAALLLAGAVVVRRRLAV